MDKERQPLTQSDRIEYRVFNAETRIVAIQTMIARIEANNLVRYDRQIDRSAALLVQIVWGLRLCTIAFLIGVLL